MKRLAASSLCLLALAATAPAALGQSAGDDQYADPFSGQEQSQSSPKSAPTGDDTVAGQTESDSTLPAAANQSPTPQSTAAGTPSGSSSSLPYTGFPAGLVALLGALVLTAGVMLRVMTGRPPVRRGTVPVLGRDVRLAPRSRQR